LKKQFISLKGLKKDYRAYIGIFFLWLLGYALLNPEIVQGYGIIIKNVLPPFMQAMSTLEFLSFIGALIAIVVSDMIFPAKDTFDTAKNDQNKFRAIITKYIGIGSAFIVLQISMYFREGMEGVIHHWTDPHELGLLINLGLLLLGFEKVGDRFEKSGFAEKIGKYINSVKTLMWIIYILSIFLDNIAAGLIGVILLRSLYGAGGKKISHIMIFVLIATSNNGGAASFIGDVTTVMLYLEYKVILPLLVAFVATVPVQVLLNMYAASTKAKIQRAISVKKAVDWGSLWILLAIPGLVVGNVAWDAAGIGLWIGIIVGLILETIFDVKKNGFCEDEHNTTLKKAKHVAKGMDPKLIAAVKHSGLEAGFLVLLVATAGLLPLQFLDPVINMLSRDQLAFMLGELSPFFDNIPLTAIAIQIGNGFKLGFLAYEVGFKGSALWFGSSSGVAIAGKMSSVKKVQNMIGPFIVIKIIGLIGTVILLSFYRHVLPVIEYLNEVYSAGTVVGFFFLIIIIFLPLWTKYKFGNTWFLGKGAFRAKLKEMADRWDDE